MSAHDRYLAAYRTHETSVWCSNRECPTYGDEQTVLFESEYGQVTVTPEECSECRGHWVDEPPSEEDDE